LIQSAINPVNEGERKGEFDLQSKPSSIRPMKAGKMGNLIINPKRHQSGKYKREKWII